MADTSREQATITGIINGTNIALAMIVHELNAKGVISKEVLASQLERAAQEAGRNRPAGELRVDLLMFRNLAKLLRKPTPRPDGWTPAVIEGGLSGDKDDQNSD